MKAFLPTAPTPTRTFADMLPGQLGVITDDDILARQYRGHIVLRVGENRPFVLNLTDARWKWDADAPLIVRVLSPGEIVTLTQEEA